MIEDRAVSMDPSSSLKVLQQELSTLKPQKVQSYFPIIKTFNF